jgi:hypothetical protein
VKLVEESKACYSFKAGAFLDKGCSTTCGAVYSGLLENRISTDDVLMKDRVRLRGE